MAAINTTALQTLVNAIFKFAERQFPWFASTLEWVLQQLVGDLGDLHTHLASAGVGTLKASQGTVSLSQADLITVVDQLFAKAEALFASRPIVLYILKAVNAMIDSVGITALVEFLKARGFVIA
jgi:hypothetical protein